MKSLSLSFYLIPVVLGISLIVRRDGLSAGDRVALAIVVLISAGTVGFLLYAL